MFKPVFVSFIMAIYLPMATAGQNVPSEIGLARLIERQKSSPEHGPCMSPPIMIQPEIEKLENKKIAEIIPVGKITKISVPYDSNSLSDQQILAAILKGRIVKMTDKYLSISSCQMFFIWTDVPKFEVCISSAAIDHGTIIFTGHRKGYQFSLPK